MTRTTAPARRLLLFTALSLFPALGGCGGDGLGTRYSVSGKVTYKGEPVSKGQISFVPIDPGVGRAAGGVINDGQYTLTTQDEDDGALAGKYKVTIIAKNLQLDAAQAKSKALGTNIIIPGQLAKANKAAKNLVPAKYGLPDTSNLSAEVKESSNSLNFELTD